MTLPITEFSSIKISDNTYADGKAKPNTDGSGSLVLGRMTTAQTATLINNETYTQEVLDPLNPNTYKTENGTLIYDTTKSKLQVSTAGAFVDVGGGAGAGNLNFIGNAVDVVKGTVLVFATSGNGTDVALSKAAIDAANAAELDRLNKIRIEKVNKNKALANNINEENVIVGATNTNVRIKNLGILQFGTAEDETNQQYGMIALNGSISQSISHAVVNATLDNTCSVFTGGALDKLFPTSPLSIIEINSEEGGLMLSRLTTAQITALPNKDLQGDPINNTGLMLYDTDLKELKVHNGTDFVAVGSGGGTTVLSGNVTALNGITGVVVNCATVSVASVITATHNLGTVAFPGSVANLGNIVIGSIIDKTSFTIYSTVKDDTYPCSWTVIG